MSLPSSEPWWFCHECHSEMRPLRVPDPVCASCRGTFVEQMENNAADDPRGFQQHAHVLDDPLDAETGDFYHNLTTLVQRTMTGPSTTQTTFSRSTGGTFTIGGGSTLGGRRARSTGSQEEVPSLADFLLSGPHTDPNNHFGPQDRGQGIAGPMLAQYLAALLGQQHGTGLGDGGFRGPPGAVGGQWGDYVFNQEALDQILTQLMETSQSGKPVPATDEIMQGLPREVLKEASPTLEKDCAVCKEQFSLTTDDPDELVVVSLPCSHPFHEGCIMPWLKSSGTCPVCRHALIPQPEHHAPGDAPAGSPNAGPSSSRRPHVPDNGPGGVLNSLMGFIGGGGGGGGGGPSSASPSSGHPRTASEENSRARPVGERSNSNGQRQRRQDDDHPNLPGGWGDLD